MKLIGPLFTIAVLVVTVWLALAVHYWLGWPDWVRTAGPIILILTVVTLWFGPWNRLGTRGVAAAVLVVLTTFYVTKPPAEQDWVPLMERHIVASIDGSRAALSNVRDARHAPGATPIVRWTDAEVDLSQIEGADIILQPFGNFAALSHVMVSFRFANGRNLVVSMEARRAQGGGFDALAGFFRHDQIYPLIGTERDLLWERLARTPPDTLQFFPVQRAPEEIRTYFERILVFANGIAAEPKFYSTLTESCMTSLIRLAPEAFANVPVWDIRRWIPGYSLGLFQDVGLVESDIPPAALAERQTLNGPVLSPDRFEDAPGWSAYIRGLLSAQGATTTAALPN